MRSLWITLRKAAITAHRWLGVALSLLFTVWFSSGIVMMYWSFPSVSEGDRIAHLPSLTAASIRISPSDAFSKLTGSRAPDRLRILVFDGRPVYRFTIGAQQRIIYADTGDEQTQVSPEMVSDAAARWTGLSIADAQVQRLDGVDQWTVQVRARPLWKFTWPDGQQVYVSGVTGEVVQYTTSESRLWAWLGAIPHWFYFAWLRKSAETWAHVVIWASGLGTFTAVLGLVVAASMYSPAKQYRQASLATSIPYQGWKRWHMIVGLAFGVVAATWAFSGLLSMGEGSERPLDFEAVLRGPIPLSAFDGKPIAAALTQVAGMEVKQLELISVHGRPVYLASLAGHETRVIPVDGLPARDFDAGALMKVLRETAGEGRIRELRIMTQYDRYYLDRRQELPLPVIYLRTNDPAGTRYYIDPKTARIVNAYSSAQWVERWLYHGLHSWNFPWLYRYRPLWDIVVISLLLGGTALCATSLVLAFRVMARRAARLTSETR